MSVRKRKDGRWQIDVVVRVAGQRIRSKRSGGRTRAEALEAEHAERQRLKEGGGLRVGKGVTVAEFAAEFLSGYVEANCKHATKIAYRSIVEQHLVPELGGVELEQLGPQLVERYKAKKLTAELAPKTVNNHLIVIGRMLTIAKEWRRLTGPLFKLRHLKLPPHKIDFLTFDESARLIAAADDGALPLILTSLRTGLRIGELAALRWEDVDLVAGRVNVRQAVYKGVVAVPKGGRSREVPLSEETRAALRSLRSRFAGGLVFPGPSGGHLSTSSSRSILWRTCRRAGLRLVRSHLLRHTFASHLVMRGVPLKVVQELLGHATIDMTMRYAHLSPDVSRDAVSLLDAPAPSARKAAADGHG